jgi:ABC-2 type transport system permease protein
MGMALLRKALLVANYEFWRHVKRRGFIFAVLGLPILGAGLMLVTIVLILAISNQPVGIIDYSQQLLPPESYSEQSPFRAPLRSYEDESLALVDLELGDLQGVVVVSADYLDSGQLAIYHRGSYFDGFVTELQLYLRSSLLAGSETAVQRQLSRPPATRFVSLTETAEPSPPLITYMLPFGVGFIFILGIFTSAGYLIQAVVDEKENRTMEIMVTSMTPLQLISGKIVGLTSVGLLQISIWTGMLLVAVRFILLAMPEAPPLTISPLFGLIVVAWFIPFYLLIATLMVALGLSVTNMGEAQQGVGIITMMTLFPTYLAILILAHPNSSMAVAFTLFPFSSPVTLLVRSQITAVPPAQYVASWLLLIGTLLLAIWAASRLLQYGLLRYQQRLQWRSLLARLGR